MKEPTDTGRIQNDQFGDKFEDQYINEPAHYFNDLVVPKDKVIWIDSRGTLAEAAHLMKKHRLSSLMVMEDKNGTPIPVGVLTNGDMNLETLSQRIRPDALTVSDIMSKNLPVANKTDDVFTLIAKMREHGLNRLPLLDEKGRLKGMVTSKKLVQYLTQGLHDLSVISTPKKPFEKQVRH